MREIQPSDAKRLSYIHRESFDNGWSESDFKQMLSIGKYFGFICDEGFIMGRMVVDEIEIFSIAVLKNFRSRGIASKLIKNFHVKTKKIGAKKIFLEVNINNEIAKKLYLSNGYQSISIRPNYYDNQDAVIMQFIVK